MNLLPPDPAARANIIIVAIAAIVSIVVALLLAFVSLVLTGHGRIVIELAAILASASGGYGAGRYRRND